RESGHFAEHLVVGGLQGDRVDDVAVWVEFQLAGCRFEQRQVAGLLDADADGIDFFAKGGGELSGRNGIDLSFIVIAIREQNDDTTFAVFNVLEVLGSRSSGIADGSTEIANEADVQAMQVFDEPIVIQSERACEIGNGGKNDETHAVTGPFLNELFED